LNDRRIRTIDDGSALRFAGAGVVIRTVAMRHVAHAAVPLGFVRTSGEAEGKALLEGLRLARSHGATAVFGRSDHLSLVEFANGREELRDPHMLTVGQELRAEIAGLSGFILRWAPSFHRPTRGDGVPAADFLARQAAGLGVRKVRYRRRR
jgi:hypothetical protein